MSTSAEPQSLLREFVASRSEDAFHRIVQLHTPLVYNAALRVAHGDVHLAQDITQVTFSSLAQKAHSLSSTIILPVWLYRHACYTARHHLRSDRRRRARESAAALMNAPETSPQPWSSIAPVLDDAMGSLSGPDRTALILRYFENQSLRSVGKSLGVTEDAAQKRVTRAIERLRISLTIRGITLSATVIANSVASEATAAAIPHGLAASLAKTALAMPPPSHFATLTTITARKLVSGIAAATLAFSLWFYFKPKSPHTSTTSTQLRVRPRVPVPTATSVSLPQFMPASVSTIAAVRPPSPVPGTLPELTTPLFPTAPARYRPEGPTPRNDPAFGDAYRQHPRTLHTKARIAAVNAGFDRILPVRYRELLTRWETASKGTTPADKEEAVRITAEAKFLEGQMDACRHGWQSWLEDERTSVRTSVFAELTGQEPPPSLPAPLTPEETNAALTARTQFQNQQFQNAEAALLPLLATGPAEHQGQVAWQLMLSQLALGKFDDATKTSLQLLRGSSATACLACAADAVRRGYWDQAQIWLDTAWAKAPRSEVTALSESLVTMGWATYDPVGKPMVIPEDAE